MQVFESSLNLPFIGASRIVLLGNFDGFHLGHQSLLKESINAKKESDRLTVFTFEPHPSQILLPQGDHRRLWGPDERQEYLKSFPVDELIQQKFDLELATLTPDEFWEKYILPLNPRVLVTGEDFKFGKNRKGDVQFLTAKCAEKNIQYKTVSIVSESGEKVSTSRIKEVFMQGKLKEGLPWLGHDYFLLGNVIEGDKRGRTIGFPTANIKIQFKPSLKLGVYAVKSTYGGKEIFGVMNVGITPTFKTDTVLKVEVHFFNFNEDLYGKKMKVSVQEFIRPEQKFSSLEALIEQINADAVKARKVLKI